MELESELLPKYRECIAEFAAAYGQYRLPNPVTRISYDEFASLAAPPVEEYAALVAAHVPADRVRRTLFVDFGSPGSWDCGTTFRFLVAEKLHENDMRIRPDLHSSDGKDTTCSCGFGCSAVCLGVDEEDTEEWK